MSAELIDHVLHADRIDADGSKRTFRAELDSLPDGVFVSLADALDQPFLIQGQSLLAWSPGGYRERRPRPAGQRVSVLTPKSTIATFRRGLCARRSFDRTPERMIAHDCLNHQKSTWEI